MPVLERGVAVIRDLVGPPNRPLDDSRPAQTAANAFAAGCRVLAELAQELQTQSLWVEYGLVIDCLEGWLNHRLGADSSSGRIDDLVDKGTQPFPYGRELEATAEALADIAITAYSTGFDHVARSAVATLLHHAERALCKDPVAFVLTTRAVSRVHAELFGAGGTEVRELAEYARVVDLMTSLQEENLRLLTAVLKSPRTGDHADSAPWAQATRAVRVWTLRPVFRTHAFHGQLALAIARTAQSVRSPAGRFPVHRRRGNHRLSEDDFMELWREARTFRLGRAYDLDEDLRIALIQALWPSEGTEPGLEVFRAGVRWRAALDAAEAGAEGEDRVPGIPADLAGHGLSGEGRLSPEARIFGQRIAAWAKAPWCRTLTASPTYALGGDALVYIPAASDPAVTDLGALTRHYRDARNRQITESEFGDLPDDELQATGLLWGSWPPPSGCPQDPWNARDWSTPGTIAYRLEQYRADQARGWLRRKLPDTDRVYQARFSGAERIVVTEPDGSSRLLRGIDMGREPFSLVYGGRGQSILARRLTTDALGSLALCPVCHGGSAADWMPGWCRTCRGLRQHPDLGRAEQAVARAVAQKADGRIEWDISRSELLDAVAALNTPAP